MISRLQLKDYLPPMLGFKSPQATNFFPRLSNSSATPIHILQFLAANRVARSASQEEETPWRKGTSAALLYFLLVDRFSVTKAKNFPLLSFTSPSTPLHFSFTHTLDTPP